MEGAFWALSGGIRHIRKQAPVPDTLVARADGKSPGGDGDAGEHEHGNGLDLPAELDILANHQVNEKTARTKFPTKVPERTVVAAKRSRSKTPKIPPKVMQSEEQIVRLRKEKAIKVDKSVDLSAPMGSFSEYLPPALVTGLTKMGLLEPTAIQMQSIPAILEGHEVLGVAPTGSGKTLSFLLPAIATMCERTSTAAPRTRSIVVAPSVELAEQIGRVAKELISSLRVDSCMPVELKVVTSKSAMNSIRDEKPDLVIGTPMRILDCLKKEEPILDVSKLENLILDEADKLFETEFLEQIDSILFQISEQCKTKYRRHLFSATLPPAVESAARSVLLNPVKITVGSGSYGGGTAAIDEVAARIEQSFLFAGGCGEQGKIMALRNLLREGVEPPILIFVESKERAAELLQEIGGTGVKVDALHSSRSQAQRQRSIEDFRSGRTWVLICTDVLARGLDFKGVATVVNFDFPTSAVGYVHRIGRTGRAGRNGSAITIFTEEDKPFLRSVANVAAASGARVPEWMLSVSGASRRRRKELEKQGYKRRRKNSVETIGGPAETKYDRRRRLRKADMIRNRRGNKDEAPGATGEADAD